MHFSASGLPFPTIWSPVDDHQMHSDTFFSDNPWEIILSNTQQKVPLMIGTMKDEGLLFTSTFIKNPEKLNQVIDQ